MISYFDTSALVPLIIDEPGTGEAGRLWDDSDRVVTVRLAFVEAAAALAQANRLGRLTATQHDDAKRQAVLLFSATDFIEIDTALADHAAHIAESHALRAYDAMHLASALAAADAELVFVAGDRALVRAAAAAGLTTATVTGG